MIKYFLPLLAALFLNFGCSKANNASSVTANFKSPHPARTLSYAGDMVSSAQFSEMPAAVEYSMAEENELLVPAAPPRPFPEGRSLENDLAERKLTKYAHIRIRVEDLEKTDSAITELMAHHNAYAVSTSIDENSSHYYFIRVPSMSYNDFLDGMDGIGRVLSRSENTEDVTLRYYDLEGRLAVKLELLKTFRSYLGRARNIEEILSVETRIAELQNEIDGTGSMLRDLANRVDFASVELTILGPVTFTPYRGPTLSERFKELAGNFGQFMLTLALVFAGIVMYGIPILAAAAFFFWLLFGKIGLLKKLWRLTAGKHKVSAPSS